MENVAISAKKNITMEKYYSQLKIVTPNNILKVFGVYARSVISSVELVNNYLIVSGKIIANAVYLSDENIVENTETSIDFVEKQKTNFVASELVCDDSLEIHNINVSSSEIICSVLHNSSIEGIYRYLVGDALKIDDEFVCNKKTINCLNFKQSCDDNFVVVEEIESNLKNIKVLNISSSVIVNSVVSSVDKVVIDGKVKVNALYKDEDSIGEIVKEFEFKQEIASQNAVPGMNAWAKLGLVNTAISEQARDDKTFLAFVIDLSAKVYLFESVSVETFDDIFSLKHEIVPTYDFAEFNEDVGIEFETDTSLTQTDISGFVDFDDIVGVFEPQVLIHSFEDKGDKINVSAQIQAMGLYKTTDSLEKFNLVKDVLFEKEKDMNEKLKNVNATANVSMFKVKAGKDLECAFNIEYQFVYENELSEKFVKSFDIVKEKQQIDAGVKVYVARDNQTIFDVAKALNVTPELIVSQNEIGDCFESGQKVFVYCPLNIV